MMIPRSASARTATSTSLRRLSAVAGWLGGLTSKRDPRSKRDDDDLDPPRPNAVVTLLPAGLRLGAASALPLAFA
jgi:hypothetical protein